MRQRIACVLLALSLLLAVAAAAAAQPLPSTVPEDSWGPVGSVATVARSGDTLYVGGIFDYVGPPTGPFAEVDSTGALLSSGLPDVTRVFDACALPGGGWLIAALEGQTIDVRRLDARGVVDPSWIVADVPQGAPIACDATTLYLAGGTGLVAFDIAARTQLPWSVSVAGNLGSVQDLLLDQGRLYIQGDFTTLNGQLLPAQGFGAVAAATAAVVPVTPTGLSAVTAMAAAGDTLFLGGLDQMGPAGVAIAISTGQSRPWSPIYAFRGPTRLVATTQRVFGFFGAGSFGGSLVSLDPATGAPQGPPMATDAQGAMAVANGTLYAVRNTKFKAPGGLSQIAGQHLSLFDVETLAFLGSPTAIATFTPDTNPPGVGVERVVASGGRIALAGRFPSAGGSFEWSNLFALDLRTRRPRPFGASVDGPVRALVSIGDVVVVGGDFSTVNGQPARSLAALAGSGALLPWFPLQGGAIYDLAASGRYLYAAGTFTTVFGQPRPQLVAFDLTTAGVTAWAPSPNGSVYSLATSLGVMAVSGDFSTISGSARDRIAAFADGATSPLLLAPAPDGTVEGVATLGSQLAMWGRLSTTQGQLRGGLWVFDASGNRLPIPSPVDEAYSGVAGANRLYLSSAHPAAPITVALETNAWTPLPWSVPVRMRLHSVEPDWLVASLESTSVTVINGRPTLGLALFPVPSAGPPQQLRARVTGSTVSLSWAPPPGAAPTSYLLDVGTAAGAANLGRFPVGAALVASVAPATYYMRVRAVANGTPGEASSELIVTVPATPTPPQAPATLTGAVAGASVTLSWSAAAGNPESYVIEAGTGPGLANLGAIDTGVLDTRLAVSAPPGTYYVRIRATNAFGQSAPSNDVVLVVP